MAKVPADPLTTLEHFRGILDALASGGVIPAGGYASLRRTLLSDTEVAPYLPRWLRDTRTEDEFRALLYGQHGDPLEFVRKELEPAFAHFESQTFVPSGRRVPAASIGAVLRIPSMVCPRCSVTVRPESVWQAPINGDAGDWQAASWLCPSCDKNFVTTAMRVHTGGPKTQEGSYEYRDIAVVWPRSSSRPPLPPEVPEPYAGLYREAALILDDSPRASAMLSRRCLQHLLREEAHAPKLKNLHDEIEWAIENAGLPPYVTESIHEPRIVGNMGAHPTKSEDGEYIEVVAGEADWMLDVLDSLFEFYFVAKARTAARKAALAERIGK